MLDSLYSPNLLLHVNQAPFPLDLLNKFINHNHLFAQIHADTPLDSTKFNQGTVTILPCCTLN